MTLRAVHFLACVAIAFATACTDPIPTGFRCGGLEGFVCPPASSCEPCSDPDCGGPCSADTACDPATSACPNGTTCDPTTLHCLPSRSCATRADCSAGAFCVTNRLSKGICAIVPESAPTSCGLCPFPWTCTLSGCRLACLHEECPGALRCVNHVCVP